MRENKDQKISEYGYFSRSALQGFLLFTPDLILTIFHAHELGIGSIKVLESYLSNH